MDPDDIFPERSPWPVIRFFAAMAIAAFVMGAIGWFALRPAHAHEAPSGWRYPLSCCSGYDCRVVDEPGTPPEDIHHSVQVLRVDGGYQISTTGEIIHEILDGKRNEAIKVSPDGEVHWCSVAGKDDGKTICLFRSARDVLMGAR